MRLLKYDEDGGLTIINFDENAIPHRKTDSLRYSTTIELFPLLKPTEEPCVRL